jgi:hypothetical protein
MKLSYLFLLLIIFETLSAQNKSNMEGEYYLRGVMETASGFKLNADSTFEFFYSYGALDRFGSGTWKRVSGNIIFESRSRPQKDFLMTKSEKSPGNFTTIRIIDKNEFVIRYVDAVVKNGNAILEKSTDNEGIIRIPKQPVDSIALLFRLCPDRYTTFHIPDKTHNSFEFRFEPWIAEVFFEKFSLKVENNKLTGRHPLLRGESFVYEK